MSDHFGTLTQRSDHPASPNQLTRCGPLATFILRLGPSCFGYWRQSMDRSQSIFCLSNITKTEQTLRVSDVNLISTQDWYDLLSGEILPAEQQIIKLAPYQTLWLTNHYAH